MMMFEQQQIHQDHQVFGLITVFNSENSIEQKADHVCLFTGYNQLLVILIPVNPKIAPAKFKIDT